MQYRRFNIYREDYTQVEEFYTIVREEFGLSLDMPFHISYTDPIHQDLLPINNDDNLAKSLSTANPHIKLFLYRREGNLFLFEVYKIVIKIPCAFFCVS